MVKSWIVVGIDGSETARAALYWAATEAGRRKSELIIAHAGDVEADQTSTEYGSSLLLEAEAAVFESPATCAVTTRISNENPLRFLTELGRDADLLVVGSHGLGHAAGVVLGSIASRVAAHATCPVAVIPRSWQPKREPTPVVLGVSATAAGRAPMHFAFAQARSLGVPVLAVRAWSRMDWTGELSDLMYKTMPAFEAAQAAHLEDVLGPVREAFPDVQVQQLVCGGRVQDILRRESTNGQLLVIGSRFGDGHAYSRLGLTTSGVLEHSRCPVVVVGHQTLLAAEDSVGAGQAPVASRA